MNKIILFGFLMIVMISSCTNDNTSHKNISFYHWKSKAEFNKSYQKALSITQTNKIYLHYFDIEIVHEPSWSDDGQSKSPIP
jgi:amino acid permease